MISVTKMQQGEVGEIQSLVPHNRPSSQYKIQTAAFRLGSKCSLRLKSVASLETQYNYPAVRMGSSNTFFFFCVLLLHHHFLPCPQDGV